jgi:hypothetical protein
VKLGLSTRPWTPLARPRLCRVVEMDVDGGPVFAVCAEDGVREDVAREVDAARDADQSGRPS